MVSRYIDGRVGDVIGSVCAQCVSWVCCGVGGGGRSVFVCFFFFNDTATTEIYTE